MVKNFFRFHCLSRLSRMGIRTGIALADPVSVLNVGLSSSSPFVPIIFIE
jgi:hypothetical protein